MTTDETEYHRLVKSLTDKDILAKFPEVVPLAKSTGSSSSTSSSSNSSTQAPNGTTTNGDGEYSSYFKGHDLEQIKLMDENCIVLDYNDNPVGSGTKKLCHILSNIEAGLLHRAFSVFLFNDKNELLLQQRSVEKITFPGMWTNTCCSHPLCIPSELSGIQGAKFAAIRKLEHELGIKSECIPLENFKFLTRIHYVAPNGDDTWGEHEIDYILIIKAEPNLDALNFNEVKDVKFVSQQELTQMFQDPNLVFTPWFKLICENYLFKWWDEIDTGLEKFVQHDIQRLL